MFKENAGISQDYGQDSDIINLDSKIAYLTTKFRL